MPRTELLDGDLSWFDLEAYKPSSLSSLRLVDWCHMLQERLSIRRRIDEPAPGTPFELQPGFERTLSLFEAPDGYFELDKQHETATPSINLLSVSEVHELGHLGAIQLFYGDSSQPFDLEVGAPQVELVSNVVRVGVDLGATRAQLMRDFGRWLDNMEAFIPRATHRNYTSTVKEWADGLYLPFYDLTLFADFKEATIAPQKMTELLQLGVSEDFSDALKVARRSLSVFRTETLRALRMQVLEEDYLTKQRNKQDALKDGSTAARLDVHPGTKDELFQATFWSPLPLE